MQNVDGSVHQLWIYKKHCQCKYGNVDIVANQMLIHADVKVDGDVDANVAIMCRLRWCGGYKFGCSCKCGNYMQN